LICPNLRRDRAARRVVGLSAGIDVIVRYAAPAATQRTVGSAIAHRTIHPRAAITNLLAAKASAIPRLLRAATTTLSILSRLPALAPLALTLLTLTLLTLTRLSALASL
jgi:hypothetical protein